MNDVPDGGRDHYRATGLTNRPDFAQLVANLGRNLMEGRLGILTAVFETAINA